ncbi:hypothetical protein ACVXG7_00980 [Enterobacter hormaechei]
MALATIFSALIAGVVLAVALCSPASHRQPDGKPGSVGIAPGPRWRSVDVVPRAGEMHSAG